MKTSQLNWNTYLIDCMHEAIPLHINCVYEKIQGVRFSWNQKDSDIVQDVETGRKNFSYHSSLMIKQPSSKTMVDKKILTILPKQ